MTTINETNQNKGMFMCMPLLRVRTKALRKNDISGCNNSFEVQDRVVEALWDGTGGARTLAAAHLAYARLRAVEMLMGRKEWDFPIYAQELALLAHAEKLFGTDYPEGEREVARLDALPCQPYADEVATGLFHGVRWLITPANIVRFGLSADHGAYL